MLFINFKDLHVLAFFFLNVYIFFLLRRLPTRLVRQPLWQPDNITTVTYNFFTYVTCTGEKNFPFFVFKKKTSTITSRYFLFTVGWGVVAEKFEKMSAPTAACSGSRNTCSSPGERRDCSVPQSSENTVKGKGTLDIAPLHRLKRTNNLLKMFLKWLFHSATQMSFFRTHTS